MLNSFRYTIKQAFGQVFRNKTMSIASVFSITAMLLILGIFFILVININMVTESVKADYDTIEVFMQEDASKEDAQAIIDGMTGFDGVESATYRTKKEALAILKDRWGDQGYLLDNLAKNPLPDSVVIKISSLEKAQAIADKAKTFNGIEKVNYYKQTVDKIMKVTDFIQLAALITINLGLFNLLPFPALDGGRVFFILVEIIIRRKIPADKEGMVHFIGFALLILLMLFATWNDIVRLISK